jgi:uncharacterized protein (UPF0276 family)
MNTFSELPRLGVGLLYNPALRDFLRTSLDAVDYIEVMPDMAYIDRGIGQRPRFVGIPEWTQMLDGLARQCPLVAHNISLSIGSADLFDREYVMQVAEWQRRYGFVWHSDHLSFARVTDGHGGAYTAGMAVPIPYDAEMLDLIARRVRAMREAVACPFLLENNVAYIDIPEQEMTEPEFLNRLAGGAGCGLLLDLHNVYVNAVNHGFDPLDFLNALDMTNVVEIHIAGGNELGGMYADTHSGPCPAPVWELLERVVSVTPNLCGITFEFHESYFPVLGEQGILAELEQARTIWQRGRTEKHAERYTEKHQEAV